MKKKRFSVEHIVGVLKQVQVGVAVAEVIRKEGISEQTFYRWKSKYAGLEVDQVRQMAQLQEENSRLKQLVAELTLDKTMLQDVLSKNGEAFATRTGCSHAEPAEARARHSEGVVLRQRQRVRQSGDGSVGLQKRGQDRLLSSWQANR